MTTSEDAATSSAQQISCANARIWSALGRSRYCLSCAMHPSRTVAMPRCSDDRRRLSMSSSLSTATEPLYMKSSRSEKEFWSTPYSSITLSLESDHCPRSITLSISLDAASTARCALKSFPSTRIVTSHSCSFSRNCWKPAASVALCSDTFTTMLPCFRLSFRIRSPTRFRLRVSSPGSRRAAGSCEVVRTSRAVDGPPSSTPEVDASPLLSVSA
mmetsp:Transcript_46897/g.111589  ORF Transcript_46897/g.111589 Transcript_46897/m.111589 type:complete len:215 (-) Transcript_46897:368-1012(-)